MNLRTLQKQERFVAQKVPSRQLFFAMLSLLTVMVVLSVGVVGSMAQTAAPFTPPATPSSIERKLVQWDALLADESWADAIDLAEQLQLEHGEVLIKADLAGSDRYRTMAQKCQAMLLSLPPKGLVAYRKRVDRTAEELLATGLENLDKQSLQQVVQEYLASSSGDEALVALGELAFVEGDMAAARRAWLQVDAKLRGPLGEPIELALAGIPANVNAELLAKIWLESPRPANELTYPDADINLPEMLTRLVLSSLQSDNFGRAEAELRLLKAIAPEQSGWLAGREQPLAGTLWKMLANAKNDKPFAASQSLPMLSTWRWGQSIDFPVKQQFSQAAPRILQINQLGQRVFVPGVPKPKALLPESTPVVSEQFVALPTAEGLKAWQLTDGEELSPQYFGQKKASRSANTVNRLGGQQIQIINGRVVSRSLINQPTAFTNSVWPGTLAAHQDHVYFATIGLRTNGARTARRQLGPTKLLGIAPHQEGKVTLELSTEGIAANATFFFAGPPVLSGDQLFVVLSTRTIRRELAIACYSVSSSRLLWNLPVGSTGGNPNLRAAVAPLTVTLGPDTVYLAADLGVIAAVDKQRGTLRWLTRYSRDFGSDPAAGNQPLAAQLMAVQTRTAQPNGSGNAILLGDRLYVAPSDSQAAFALDTGTGQIVWLGNRTDRTAQIVAVTPKTILFAGKQLEGLDPITGNRRYLFPESQHAGLRGLGKGLLAGNEYFWPTRREIIVINPDYGTPTRQPIGLRSVGSAGAVLTRQGDSLVVTGPNRLNVLGKPSSERLEPIPQFSRLYGTKHQLAGWFDSKKSRP